MLPDGIDSDLDKVSTLYDIPPCAFPCRLVKGKAAGRFADVPPLDDGLPPARLNVSGELYLRVHLEETTHQWVYVRA